MTDIRDEVIRILAYRCEETARCWAKDCPAESGGNERATLAHINRHLFRLLSKLPHVSDRQIGCLSGNWNRTDHWLMDFANVIAPLMVEHRKQLFDVKRRAPVMGALDKILSDQVYDPLINPMMV